MVNMSYSAICLIEKGKTTLSADSILLFAEALGITPNILLGYQGKKFAEDIFRECSVEEKLYLNRLISAADEEYHRIIKK